MINLLNKCIKLKEMAMYSNMRISWRDQERTRERPSRSFSTVIILHVSKGVDLQLETSHRWDEDCAGRWSAHQGERSLRGCKRVSPLPLLHSVFKSVSSQQELRRCRGRDRDTSSMQQETGEDLNLASVIIKFEPESHSPEMQIYR